MSERCSPNTRDASLMLIPSTRHALRTRKYMSTMYILVTFHQSLDRLYRKVAGGTVLCLSQKFATSRNRDGRCSIELAIAARGVAPSGFYEWKMCDRRDGAPKCEMQGSPFTRSHMKAEQAAVLARHIRQSSP